MNDRLEPRLRILLGSSIAIGPGKEALLELIGETGSIAAGVRCMGMSYRRAWVLTKDHERVFSCAVGRSGEGWCWRRRCVTDRDGSRGSGALRGMENHAATAVGTDMEDLRKLMVNQPPED